MALLDTGAEVSLVLKALLPASAIHDAASPLRLITANNQLVQGGDKEVELMIRFCGVGTDTGSKHLVLMPTTLLEAEIDEDVILSYRGWGREASILLRVSMGSGWPPPDRSCGSESCAQILSSERMHGFRRSQFLSIAYPS